MKHAYDAPLPMPKAVEELVQLADVPTELEALTGERPPSYRHVYLAVLDRKFESVKRKHLRYVRRADLPRIARHFGLTVPNMDAPSGATALSAA